MVFEILYKENVFICIKIYNSNSKKAKGEPMKSTKKNQVLYFPKVREAAFEDVEIPIPGEAEVLIKTSRTLISTGTEMTAYCGAFEPGTTWAKYFSCPYYPGYNNIGTVVELGKGVGPEWLGKRVATNCAHAAYVIKSLHGEENQAKGKSECHPVPDAISDDDAVFFSIPQIVMNGIRASKIQWGESAAVYGLGLLGQFAVRFLLEAGACPVIGVDPEEHRRDLLPDCGPVIRVDPRKENVEEVLLRANSGRKADVVIELTGNAGLLQQEASLLRTKGRLVILSSPKHAVPFDFHDFCVWPSISIIGAHNFSHPDHAQPDYPWTARRHVEMFFDLVRLGVLDMKGLVSRKLNWKEAPTAYKLLDQNRGAEMGIILDWSDAQ